MESNNVLLLMYSTLRKMYFGITILGLVHFQYFFRVNIVHLTPLYRLLLIFYHKQCNESIKTRL
jgi:hypothetical protein